jgi:hypothetical protein
MHAGLSTCAQLLERQVSHLAKCRELHSSSGGGKKVSDWSEEVLARRIFIRTGINRGGLQRFHPGALQDDVSRRVRLSEPHVSDHIAIRIVRVRVCDVEDLHDIGRHGGLPALSESPVLPTL